MAHEPVEYRDTGRRYRTILVDPPWDRPNRTPAARTRARQAMNLHQLKSLPIPELAAPDAHLWIWCTNATLRPAYELLETWGFTPRPPVTWIKPCPGLGAHLRSSTEHLVLGTQGNNTPPTHHKTWMFTPTNHHQHRTHEEYAVIEYISPPPYLELFATVRRAGWDTVEHPIDPTPDNTSPQDQTSLDSPDHPQSPPTATESYGTTASSNSATTSSAPPQS